MGIPLGVIAGSFTGFLLVWLGFGLGHPMVKYSEVRHAVYALGTQA